MVGLNSLFFRRRFGRSCLGREAFTVAHNGRAKRNLQLGQRALHNAHRLKRSNLWKGLELRNLGIISPDDYCPKPTASTHYVSNPVHCGHGGLLKGKITGLQGDTLGATAGQCVGAEHGLTKINSRFIEVNPVFLCGVLSPRSTGPADHDRQ